jgi:8-oxo-dGTP pyrophosphatase MutT (NUDIX family)
VWLGTAAIITDQVDRVLLVHPTYREDDRWLLPGGVVEPGEHPHLACRREITEELGLPDLALSSVLAIHSLSQHHPDIGPGTPRPGEIRYVFDGGTLTPDQAKAIRLPREELSEYAFLETRDAVQRLRPVDGQILLAVHLVDHPGGQPRMGLVFRARKWAGTPEVREPDRCVSWGWWPSGALPDKIVPYTRASIEGIRAGRLYTELGW